MKRINFLYTGMMAAALAFSGCGKHGGDDPPKPTTSTGLYELHLHTYIGEQEVDAPNITYETQDGRKMSLSTAQLYLSHIQLIRLDGTAFDFPGKILLKDFSGESYVVGNADAGNYKAIRFRVGLDPETNKLSPAASKDSVLLNKPEMWFGASPQPDGYVFMNAQGKIDTTADATGTANVPFVYKIGTDANYVEVTMSDKNFTVLPDQLQFGHILIDYAKLFNGIKLSDQANLSVMTPQDNASDLGKKIAGNIPLMFMYEE